MRPYSIWNSHQQQREGKTSTIIIILVAVGFFCLLVFGVILIALVLPAVQQAREAAVRTQSKNNLKQIGLALHNYHDTYKTFPPSSIISMNPQTAAPGVGGTFEDLEEATQAGGTPQHGWLTSILPFCNQAPLYNRIDFHRPWTDPQNSPIFQSPIQSYLHPGLLRNDPNSAIVSGFGAAHYAGSSRLFKPNRLSRIREIIDGTSNTIMGGEVSVGLKPWGAPDNVRDPGAGIGQSATQFSGPHADFAQFLLADGSVRAISVKIPPATMEQLADPKDGQRVGEF